MSVPGKISEDRPMPAPAAKVHTPVVLPNPAIPLSQPIPFGLAPADERIAALAMDLHPEDMKAFLSFSAEQRAAFRYYIGVFTNPRESAFNRGAAVVSLEQMLGREMKTYGAGGSTDNWQQKPDVMGEIKAYVPEHHGVYKRASNNLWDAVEEVRQP